MIPSALFKQTKIIFKNNSLLYNNIINHLRNLNKIKMLLIKFLIHLKIIIMTFYWPFPISKKAVNNILLI